VSLKVFVSLDCKVFLISAYFKTQIYKVEYNEYHESIDNVYQNNINIFMNFFSAPATVLWALEHTDVGKLCISTLQWTIPCNKLKKYIHHRQIKITKY
jgi:hypothetical protein